VAVPADPLVVSEAHRHADSPLCRDLAGTQRSSVRHPGGCPPKASVNPPAVLTMHSLSWTGPTGLRAARSPPHKVRRR
jgi:hypothetical protein